MNVPKPGDEEEQQQQQRLNPQKLRSRMDSADDFSMADFVPETVEAEEEEVPYQPNWGMLSIPKSEDGAEDEDEKPKRKMTSTSEGTSVTAASSFYDEGIQSGGSGSGDIPSNITSDDDKQFHGLDKLSEAGEEDEDEDKDDVVPDSCCWKWTKRILGFWIIFGLLGLLIVLIGAAIEKKDFYEAQDTKSLYSLEANVCGIDSLVDEYENGGYNNGTTYSSVREAHETGDLIAHCGQCGACSTAHDLEVMARTTDTLTSDSARCAFRIFLGRGSVEKCMEKRIGFTSDCEDCWLDNIQCSFKSCKFTCIKWKLFRQENNNGEGLNDCLKCDERMCGPQFVECSGSNRRRMGIVSDIGRDADAEQCADVDVDWLSLYDN